MAHLLRAQPDAVWKRGYITVGADLQTIDQNSFVAINGDQGGTWAPASDLFVGGAGMVVAGPWQLGGGATSVTTNGTTALITFGKGTADDVFGLSSPTNTTLAEVLFEFFSVLPETVLVSYAAFNGAPPSVFGIPTLSGIQPSVVGARFMCPLRTYNGGTLETVTLRWGVYDSHATVPQLVPRMRIVAINAAGAIFPLRASDASTDGDGFQAISSATTGSAYYGGGVAVSYVYTCNQNQLIDLSQFTYWIEVIEESGAGSWAVNGNLYLGVASFYDGIATVDGRA